MAQSKTDGIVLQMPPASGPCLVRTDSGERYWLSNLEKPILIGRDSEADLRFDSKHCSRRQAYVVRHKSGVFLKPISETVPMHLNGRPVRGLTNLQHGAEIAFAEFELRFLEHDGIPAASAANLPADTAQQDSPETIEGAARVIDRLLEDVQLPYTGAGTLGRDSSNRYRLDHPRVSRQHAKIVERNGGLWIQDLGSRNGTFVNGRSAAAALQVQDGDRVDVGPFSLVYRGQIFERNNRQGNLRILARGLTRRVVDRDGGGDITILNDVSMIIPPRSFVALIGPSGSGKSTLMNALSAREPATEGEVLLNGLDFYKGFESLKQGIAMVHQDEAVHAALSVNEAVRYSAKLRLPADTTADDLDVAVEHSLRQVDLLDHKSTLIENLSGGQRKRASLANETVHDPGLLFADEVTSGLDQETDREVMGLLRKSADNGRTVVCVTHTLANIEEFCSLVVVMAPPGFLAFYGTPAQCVEYFGVPHLAKVYSALDTATGPAWQQRYRDSPYFQEHVGDVSDTTRAGRAMPENLKELGVVIGRRVPEVFRQFNILKQRANRLLLKDRQSLLIAAGQAITIASVLVLVFYNLVLGTEDQGWLEIASENALMEQSKHRALLFMMGLSCLWFGTSNASKEIVKENTVYQQERDVNLSVSAYVLSKLPGLLALGGAQALTVALVIAGAVGLPGGLGAVLAVLLTAIVTGTGLGLLISSVTKTQEQATTLVPIILIPQIVMAGVLAPLDGIAEYVAQFTVAGYWIVEGLTDKAVAQSLETGALRLRYPNQSEWLTALSVLALHFVLYMQAAITILTIRDSRGQSVYGDRVRSFVTRTVKR